MLRNTLQPPDILLADRSELGHIRSHLTPASANEAIPLQSKSWVYLTFAISKKCRVSNEGGSIKIARSATDAL